MPALTPLKTHCTVEMQLLLGCVQLHLEPQNEAVAQAIARMIHPDQTPAVDWEVLLKDASLHKVLPILEKSLKRVDASLVPPPLFQQLQTLVYHNTLNTLALSAELLRLLTIFQTQGIPVIPFKGPTLEALAYGDVALRTSSDLDFLLQENDYLQVKAVLGEVGYRATDDWFVDAAGELAYHTMMGEYVVQNTHTGICLDIHVRLAAIHPFVLPVDFSDFGQRLQPVKLVGREVLTLCPADLLIYLCVHGSRDRWQTLSALCDIAGLIQHQPQLDWAQILAEAQELGVERMLLLGLHLAHQLLHLDLPDRVHQQIKAQPTVQRFADRIQQTFYGSKAQPQFNLLSRSHFYLSILDRWQDRLHFCIQLPLRQLQLVCLINKRDHDFLPLPRSLYGLYYLIRPIRLLNEYRFGIFKVLFP